MSSHWAVLAGADNRKPNRRGFKERERARILSRWQDEEIRGLGAASASGTLPAKII